MTFSRSLIELLALAGLALLAPFIFPEYKSQLSFLWLFILFALTWDLQGGQMGYNSFGNIVFFGLGMYLAISMQIGIAFDLGEWTAAGGQSTFLHSSPQYFSGLAIGLVAAALGPMILALLLGRILLSMRGQYFAICTLGLGIAAGEIAAGIEIIGAGSGMSVPVWPDEAGGLQRRDYVLYFLCAVLALACFAAMRHIHGSRFGKVLNAIRDDETKAEAMGLPVTSCKTSSWMISAFFLGLAGALTAHLIGFIEPIDTAFAGATYGIWMVLMAVLGGKGTLWGPVIGALIFVCFKEMFWTYFLGWQNVMLGFLIVVAVVFFPDGIVGWWQQRVEQKRRSARAA